MRFGRRLEKHVVRESDERVNQQRADEQALRNYERLLELEQEIARKDAAGIEHPIHWDVEVSGLRAGR